MTGSRPFPNRTTAPARSARDARLLPSSIGILAFGCLALGTVGVILWPRWPEPTSDAPTLPIVIAGEVFNVPPEAIRVPLQRRAGAQARVDLVFLWPALTPPEPAGSSPADASFLGNDRIFLTIAAETDRLPAAERLKLIYPRYVDAWPTPGPDGLTLFAFREDSPYRGEDLILDRAAPDRFLARCSRDGGGELRGVCLSERRLGAADITLRFPRDWIARWRDVANGIDRLIAQLHIPDA